MKNLQMRGNDSRKMDKSRQRIEMIKIMLAAGGIKTLILFSNIILSQKEPILVKKFFGVKRDGQPLKPIEETLDCRRIS